MKIQLILFVLLGFIYTQINANSSIACPTMLVTPIAEDAFNHFCENDPIDLTVISENVTTDNDETAIFVWLDEDGNQVADPTMTLPFFPSSCVPLQYTYTLQILCEEDPAVLIDGGSFTFNIYPIESLEEYLILPNENGCETEVFSICEEGELTIVYNVAGVFSEDPPIIENTDEPFFYVVQVYSEGAFFNSPQGNLDCVWGDPTIINCPSGCPSMVFNVLEEVQDHCADETIDLNFYSGLAVTDLLEATIPVWYDPFGNVVLDPSNVTLPTPPACEMTPYVYTLEIDCASDPTLDLVGGTYTANTFPVISSNLFELPTGCETAITPTCLAGNLEILYSTDGVNFSPTPPPPLEEGDPILNIDFTIAVPNSPINCTLASTYVVNCTDNMTACPTFAIPNNTVASICEGDPFDLQTFIDELNIDGADASTIFNWTDENGSMGEIEVPLNLPYTEDGCHAQIYTFQLDVNCADDPSININAGSFDIVVYPDLTTDLVSLPTDDCETAINVNLTCDVDQTYELNIEYSTDGTNFSIIPPVLNEGDNMVNIDYQIYLNTDENNCSFINGSYLVSCLDTMNIDTMIVDTMVIEEPDTTIVDPQCPFIFLPNSPTVCNNIVGQSSIDLNSWLGNESLGNWSADSAFIDLTNPSFVDFMDVPTGFYEIVYTPTDTLCTQAFSNTIKVEYCPIQLAIPNAFSPNGDGLNDEFGLINPEGIQDLNFKVFNRWGQGIFSTSNPSTRWDGTLNGNPQLLGVYLYVIEVVFIDGTMEVYSGNVTLVR